MAPGEDPATDLDLDTLDVFADFLPDVLDVALTEPPEVHLSEPPEVHLAEPADSPLSPLDLTHRWTTSPDWPTTAAGALDDDDDGSAA